MSDFLTEYKEVYKEVVIEYEHNYQEDVRVEECHGFHTFNDVTDISKRMIRVKIEIAKNKFIDITDRLTDEEHELLMD
jgi:hypothetical protein